MLKQILIAIVTLACVSCVSATYWRSCPGGSDTLEFNIEGCAGTRLCKVWRGQVATLSMRFTATQNSETLTAVVLGKSRGMSSPMPLASNAFDTDACKFLENGASCPIVRGQEYTYRVPFLIEDFFPPTTYLIQFSLKDSASRVQSCGRTVIRVN